MNNLKKLREKSGLTQQQVADAIDTSKQNVSRHESGVVPNIPRHWLEKYAGLFNCSVSEILGGGFSEKERAGFRPATIALSGDISIKAAILATEMASRGMIERDSIEQCAKDASRIAQFMGWEKVTENLILAVKEQI